MGFIENITQKLDSVISPEQNKFEIKQAAQMELIQMAGGDDIAGTWIDANGRRFDELMNDPQYNFTERLANENTREEALNEIRTKLYH